MKFTTTYGHTFISISSIRAHDFQGLTMHYFHTLHHTYQNFTPILYENSKFHSNLMSNSMLILVDLLHLPNITRNIIFVSKFTKYNNVYIEFHSNKCFVKSHTSKFLLLEGFLDDIGLYCFKSLTLEPSRSNLTHKIKVLSPVVHNTIASNKRLNSVQGN